MCFCVSGPSKTSSVGWCLTAVMSCSKAMNPKSSEKHLHRYFLQQLHVICSYGIQKVWAHLCFACEQVRQGSWSLLIFHLKWFPDYLPSSRWGVWSRRPGEGRSYSSSHTMTQIPPFSGLLRIPCFYNVIYWFQPLSGATKERHQESLCHEGPKEEADCQQRSTRAHPERRAHLNGGSLSIHSQVSVLQQLSWLHNNVFIIFINMCLYLYWAQAT